MCQYSNIIGNSRRRSKNFIDHMQIALIIQKKKNEWRIKLRRERKRKNIQTETKKDLIQSAKEKGVLSPG